MILPGELYQNYLDQFNDFYRTTFYLNQNATVQEMTTDLITTAERHNVSIFKIVRSTFSTFSSQLDIYCDDYVADILVKDYGIVFGKSESLFSGETTVNRYDFTALTQETVTKDIEYCLIGDYNDMTAFKAELVDKYAGSFPREDGINIQNSCKFTLTAAICILLLLNIFLSFYDIQYQKKEMFLSLTMGQSTVLYYIKNILLDSVYYIIISTIVGIVLTSNQRTLPFSQFVFWGIAAIIASNLIVYLQLFKIDYKAVISDSFMSAEKKNLRFQYVLHGVCFSLVIITLASNIAVIADCLNYYRQKSFFYDHSDYYWYQSFTVKDQEAADTDAIINRFTNEYTDSMNIFYLCQGSEISEENSDLFYEANHNTIEYLKTEIDSLNDCSLDKDTYILVHKNTKLSETDIEELISWADTDSVEVLEYSNSAEIIFREFDSEPITSFVKNPVIVFYNKEGSVSEGTVKYELFLCMVQTNRAQMEAFASENNLSYSETNAVDYFEYRWTQLSRTLLINTVLFLLMLLMEILVSFSIISLEFKVNAIELALKEINGYSLFERFRKFFLETIVLWGICIISVAIVSIFIAPQTVFYEILGSSIMLIINLLTIILQIRHHENMKTTEILKGGAL